MHTNQHHTSRIISSLLAAMMLLVAVAGKSWTLAPLPAGQEKTEQSDEKTADRPEKDTPVAVSELSLHAVVTPALSFDFAKSFFTLPQNFLFHFREKTTLPLAARASFYYFSYFRHVFGHHIAPNGP